MGGVNFVLQATKHVMFLQTGESDRPVSNDTDGRKGWSLGNQCDGDPGKLEEVCKNWRTGRRALPDYEVGRNL